MKNYSKYGKGWFKESDRHRLARLGIRTGRKVATTGYGLSRINYGKIISSHEFRIDDNTTIVARSEDTRSGFRHIADLYRDGTLVESAKATYLNRTWEKYEFQSVIKELLNKAKYNETEQDKIMNKIEGKALGKIDEQFKSVAMVASLGDIFGGKSQKEKNAWKLRMIKAGLGKSFQEPEDWNTLSEEEKGKRLDKIIKLMKDKNKVNYQKHPLPPQHILNAPLPDKDKDKVPDIYDWDDDNDGVPDWKDTEGMFGVDRFKGQGVFDPFYQSTKDSDFDGVPDYKDLHPRNPHKARDWAKETKLSKGKKIIWYDHMVGEWMTGTYDKPYKKKGWHIVKIKEPNGEISEAVIRTKHLKIKPKKFKPISLARTNYAKPEIVGQQLRIRVQSPRKFTDWGVQDIGRPGYLQRLAGFNPKTGKWQTQSFRLNLSDYKDYGTVVKTIQGLRISPKLKKQARQQAKRYFSKRL